MKNKNILLFFSILLPFFLFSLSEGFENNKENIITRQDGSKGFISYTQENISSGKLKGGHA